MSAWRRIARIARPRNLQGSLVVQAVDGLPFLLSEGMRVWFVPPGSRGPRQARVLAVSPLGGETWEVRFEGVEDASAAEELAGSWCLAAKADLPRDLERDDAPVGLEGWRVEDRRLGDLGRVAQVINGPQSLLRVEGPQGEVLIPAVEEFIREIDEEGQVVHVAVPEGLVGLNDPKAGE